MSESTVTTPSTSRWRLCKWPSALVFAAVIVGGMSHSLIKFGAVPNIQTGYNAALAVLHGYGEVPIEQLKTALSITVNERHILRYNLAIALRDKGQFDEAAVQLKHAVRRKPNYAVAHRELGQLLMRRDPKAALRSLQQAVSSDPSDAEAWFMLGNTLGGQGEWKMAIGAYNRAMSLGLRRPSVHHNMATALRSIGAVNEAITQYQQALAIDPDYQRAKRALAGLQSP